MKSANVTSPNPTRDRVCRSAGCVVVAFGCLGLAGWAFRIGMLQSIVSALPVMAPNTATAFIFSGLALLLTRPAGTGSVRPWIGRGLALAVAGLGIATQCEYLLGWNAGIDGLLFPETVARVQPAMPGRPSYLAALNFSLAGLALLLVSFRTERARGASEVVGVTAILVALLGLIADVGNIPLLYGWRSLFPGTGMAWPTLAAFVILGVGLLCANPTGGLVELIASRTAGGFMLRRLVLAPVVIPLFTWWLQLLVRRTGFDHPEFASWLFAFLNIFVFTLVIWWSARLLYRAELIRRRAEDELQNLNLKLEQRVAARTSELSQVAKALNDSEARLRLVLASALDAVITADERSRITSWNSEAERIFGWSAAEAVGRTLAETIIPPQHREAHDRGLQRFLTTREGPVLNRRIEITALRRDGTEFPVELTIVPIQIGDTWFFSAFLRDITQRKHDEEAIRRLNEELEQRVSDRTRQLQDANEELESFSYSVSHDLRAPLRHIAGFSDMLRAHCSTRLGDSGRRYLNTISESARRMGRLIDDLLLFSRLGRAELFQSSVAMDELVQEVVTEVLRETTNRTIDWNLQPLPAVNGDRALLKQVWVNLISNAVKYTGPRARAQITISSHPVEHGHEFIVQDNGVGFDMKYSDKLFGVFQRLHSSSEFEGTGIGLSIVQRIVARHGGRVWAEAEIDKGATFHFTLPLTSPPSGHEKRARRRGGSRPPALAARQRTRQTS